ncbi:MAG: hypothetical protein H6907_11695 [Hyphomicrobiales bacterium]|nr:hypothetical protein [Hyphomicrobiales bacterium]MCP5372386.1 hypothetical protein [Hyphomicrobiales bacterium]
MEQTPKTAPHRRRHGIAAAALAATLAAALLGTAACAPPPLALATLTIDNLSYMVTGKSISEHLLSKATDKECSFGHLFRGEHICVDPDDGRTRGTAVAGMAAGDDLAVAPASGPRQPARPAAFQVAQAPRHGPLQAPLWPDTSFLRTRISDLN